MSTDLDECLSNLEINVRELVSRRAQDKELVVQLERDLAESQRRLKSTEEHVLARVREIETDSFSHHVVVEKLGEVVGFINGDWPS